MRSLRLTLAFLVAALFAAVSLTNASCSSSKKCGCYNGWCWAYANWERMRTGDPWCFTQRVGVSSGKKQFALCQADNDCTIKMTCGDTEFHHGDDKSRPHVGQNADTLTSGFRNFLQPPRLSGHDSLDSPQASSISSHSSESGRNAHASGQVSVS